MTSMVYSLAACIIFYLLGLSKACPCKIRDGELDCKRLRLTEVPRNCFAAGITSINLEDNQLTELRPYEFSDFSKVASIYLQYNYVSLINETAFNGLENLLQIDLTHNELTEFPRLNESSVTTLILGYNRIQQLEKRHFGGLMKLTHLDLKDNDISYIDDYTFVDACALDFLSLKGNPVKRISKAGFVGTALETLDISDTLVDYIPTAGLEGVKKLRAKDVPSLRSFPSHPSLPNIRKLSLTYHSHCCLYVNEKYRTEQGKFLPTCGPTEETVQDNVLKYRSPAAKVSGMCPDLEPCVIPLSHDPKYWPPCLEVSQEIGNHTIPACSDFVNTTATPPLVLKPTFVPDHTVAAVFYVPIECSPEPDDFNSCDDVMGNWLLRILVWLVVVVNITGNLSVIVVFLANYKRFNAIKLLLTNMAFADLGMSIYLITLAIVDAATYGEYADHAIDWKSGGGCSAIGFISVFSSILSLYSLTALTIERWYTIKYAMYGRKMGFKHALIIVAVGWVYALVMASLPLAGVSSYEVTAICLPFDLSDGGRAYIIFLLTVNLLAFCIIAGVYVFLFFSITSHGPVTGGKEANVLFKMLVLVLMDFCCWMPIIVIGIASAANRETFNISLLAAKYLMVFIYPLNSCANPFLYAIFTKPFKRDFFEFWYRFGYFEEQYYRYSRPTSTRRTMKSTRTLAAQGGQSQASIRTNISLVTVPANSPRSELSMLSPDTEISVASQGVESSTDNGYISSSTRPGKSVNFEDSVQEGKQAETSFVPSLGASNGVQRERSAEPLMKLGESKQGPGV